MNTTTRLRPIWPDLGTHLVPDGSLRAVAGYLAHSLPEADVAALRLGLPVRALPAAPQGAVCAQCAEHLADAELAYLRARAQSDDGTVWMLGDQPGDVYWALCRRAGAAWRVTACAAVDFTAGHAAVPMTLAAPAKFDNDATVAEALESALTAFAPDGGEVVAQIVASSQGAWLDFAWATEQPDPLLARFTDVAQEHGGACLQFLAPDAGHVEAVRGVDLARAMPGVAVVEVAAKPGDALRHLTSVAARDACGWVLASGTVAEAAVCLAKKAAATIEIETTAFLQG